MPTPNPDPLPSRDELTTAASEWLSRRDAGFTLVEQREFEAWLAADHNHAVAWEEVELAWRVLDRPRQTNRAGIMLRELAARRTRRRRRFFAVAATGLAAAAAAAIAFYSAPRNSPAPAGHTLVEAIVTKPERRVLEDGSVVELNAGARVAVNYSPAQRDVQLAEGEAHFTVAKNPARPFVVSAGTVTVRAVGTAFAVRLESLAADVMVTEGRVAVDRRAAADGEPPRATPASVFVGAGDRLSVPLRDDSTAAPLIPEPVSSRDQNRLSAWRGPRLVLHGTTLADAIAALNAENQTQIVIVGGELAQFRMSGFFRADNPDGFIRLLESNYGVKVERIGERKVILRRAP